MLSNARWLAKPILEAFGDLALVLGFGRKRWSGLAVKIAFESTANRFIGWSAVVAIVAGFLTQSAIVSDHTVPTLSFGLFVTSLVTFLIGLNMRTNAIARFFSFLWEIFPGTLWLVAFLASGAIGVYSIFRYGTDQSPWLILTALAGVIGCILLVKLAYNRTWNKPEY